MQGSFSLMNTEAMAVLEHEKISVVERRGLDDLMEEEAVLEPVRVVLEASPPREAIIDPGQEAEPSRAKRKHIRTSQGGFGQTYRLRNGGVTE